ncbi:MAG: hypothetical protein HFG57_11530 [Lachnospiraceae bacterium]|nr:hypothetical protein [Lachnospiraceae bacterium]
MSGWRARIGLISPIGESIERAFNRYVPEGVAVNSTKLWFPGPTIEGLIHLSDQLEKAAEMYKKQRHELLMFGCTSGSMVKGYGFDKECIRRMEKVSGVPAITTSTAVLEAFDILGMPREDYSAHRQVEEFYNRNQDVGLSLSIKDMDYAYSN